MKKLLLLALLLLPLQAHAAYISQYTTAGPGGVGTMTPPMSHFVNAYTMAANTAETVTWPTGAQWCKITGTADYWVNVNATATIPAADAILGASSALVPTPWTMSRAKGPESTFSMISSTIQQISIEFWGP